MANLFTPQEFATWSGVELSEVTGSAFAAMCMETATALVVDAASAPGWELTPSTAPRLAKLIALRVARRTFLNPDQEISSAVGPLSASILKDAAAGMSLTEQEQEQLAGLTPGGDPNAATLWTQRITRGEELELPYIDLPASSTTGNGGYVTYAVEGDTSAFDPI